MMLKNADHELLTTTEVLRSILQSVRIVDEDAIDADSPHARTGHAVSAFDLVYGHSFCCSVAGGL